MTDPTEETLEETVVNPAETAPAPTVAAPAAPPVPLPEPAPSFVYAIGQIDARFPSLSIEKEFAQVGQHGSHAGQTDREALKRAISDENNRYLARNLCWVLVIQGLETYILVPRDPVDLGAFVEAYRAEPRRDDLDVVIGVRGQIAPPEMCNGLALPIVVVDKLYSFDRETLMHAIPTDGVASKDVAKFRKTAGGLFDQLTQLADNAGGTDEHRALNYLMVRYPRIYRLITEQYDRDVAFTGVEIAPSPLSGVRRIHDVVFSFRHRETDVAEKHYVSVDTTEQYPFLVTKLTPFYGR